MHQHPHVKCFDAIFTSDKKWSIINERYDNLVKAAIPSYQKVEPLVKYLEAAFINAPLNQKARQATRCITADYQNLLSMNEKVTKIIK